MLSYLDPVPLGYMLQGAVCTCMRSRQFNANVRSTLSKNAPLCGLHGYTKARIFCVKKVLISKVSLNKKGQAHTSERRWFETSRFYHFLALTNIEPTKPAAACTDSPCWACSKYIWAVDCDVGFNGTDHWYDVPTQSQLGSCMHWTNDSIWVSMTSDNLRLDCSRYLWYLFSTRLIHTWTQW